jgi:putative transcriptional regulator
MRSSEIKIGRGSMLISAPNLTDFFKRSVIFLVEHDENGSIGFVLTKPLNYKVSEIIDGFPEFDAPVLIGGPVQTDLVNFIHKAGNIVEDTYEIVEGIFWGGSFESLKSLAEEGKLNPDDFLFFLGYAGWSPDQLKNEIINNSWIVTNSKKEYVFNQHPDKLWHDILKGMGGEYSLISTFPEDPSVN